MSRLKEIGDLGQSIWLDFIERGLMTSGALAKLVEQDGICGLTSNPAIFEKAIGGGDRYDEDLRKLLAQGDADANTLFEQVAIADIRLAADVMQPVYEKTGGADGYVSLEVAPQLAFDTAGTLADARRLWKAVGKPNLMIKVPGTAPGIAAMRQLIGEGINVNVTLLFAREAYRATAEAYIAGIETYAEQHGDASRVASVASFFVSRIDAEMDAAIAARSTKAGDAAEKQALAALAGKVAIANAKLAYQDFLQIFDGPRWQRLVTGQRARPQRLLWASTGTKNPAYRDVLYMEELIGAQTVNTVPPATMDAFRDHGVARASLQQDVAAAAQVMREVERLGLPMHAVTDKLLVDGVKLFADADDKLKAAIERKRAALR